MDAPPAAVIGLPDTSFTIGARVLVGGLKPGRLRYIGSVHFVPDSEGQWCGVELDDPDGLHDGTVDGVSYFTCRDGHGILAPRHRVALHYQPPVTNSPRNPWASLGDDAAIGPAASTQQQQQQQQQHRATSGIPSPSVQLRRKKINQTPYTATLNSPLQMISSDALPLRSGIGMEAKQSRPLSASMIVSDNDDQQLVYTNASDAASKRSSLTCSRPLSAFVQAAVNIRSSPKRVTFFDEVCHPTGADQSAVRGRTSQTVKQRASQNYSTTNQRPEVEDRGWKPKMVTSKGEDSVSLSTSRRSRSADGRKLIESMSHDHDRLSGKTEIQCITEQSTLSNVVNVDDYIELSRFSSSRSHTNRRTPTSDTEQQIDSAIADVPTPPETEMQLSVDSIDSNDWSNLDNSSLRSNKVIGNALEQPGTADNRKKSFDNSLTKFYNTLLVDDWMTSHQSSDCCVSDADVRTCEQRHSELVKPYLAKVSLSCDSLPDRGGTAGHGGQNKAGLEVARTALAQYADLVRAAQQCRRGFTATHQDIRSKQPSSSSDTDISGSGTTGDRLLEMTISIIDKNSSTAGQLLPPQQLASAKKGRRLSVETTWDSWQGSTGSSSVGGGEDVEFETFDGEELLLDAAMIDSIDGGSVHSEDSMAMVAHLSDLEDENEHDLTSDEAHRDADFDDDRLRISVYDDDSLNVSMDLGGGWSSTDDPLVDKNEKSMTTMTLDDEGNVTVGTLSNAMVSTKETINDVGWLNDMNNVISRQLRQPWTLMVSADFERSCGSEDELRPASGSVDATSDLDGRTERPMSMVSNTSSIDTGE